MGNSNRKNFLFFTSEGFTFDSNNKKIENMQILGDGFGNDILEAFKNFRNEQKYLEDFSFKNIMAIQTVGVLLKIKSKAQQKLNNAMNKRNTTLFFQLSEKKFQLSNL